MGLHYKNYHVSFTVFRLALMHLKFQTREGTVPSNPQFSSHRKEAEVLYGTVLPTLRKLL